MFDTLLDASNPGASLPKTLLKLKPSKNHSVSRSSRPPAEMSRVLIDALEKTISPLAGNLGVALTYVTPAGGQRLLCGTPRRNALPLISGRGKDCQRQVVPVSYRGQLA